MGFDESKEGLTVDLNHVHVGGLKMSTLKRKQREMSTSEMRVFTGITFRLSRPNVNLLYVL